MPVFLTVSWRGSRSKEEQDENEDEGWWEGCGGKGPLMACMGEPARRSFPQDKAALANGAGKKKEGHDVSCPYEGAAWSVRDAG